MAGEEEGRGRGRMVGEGKEGEERGWQERRKGRGEDTLTYSRISLFLTCSHDIENDTHAPAVYSLPVSPHSRSLEYLWCEVAGGATQSLHQ